MSDLALGHGKNGGKRWKHVDKYGLNIFKHEGNYDSMC